MTIIASDNFLLLKSTMNHFLYLKFKSFYACAEPKVEISTQDGRMGYLSLILYLREGTSLQSSFCYPNQYKRCSHLREPVDVVYNHL